MGYRLRIDRTYTRGQALHMRKRLMRLGSSLALVIDRPLLERLGIDATTEIDLDVQGGSLIMTPAQPAPNTQEEWYAALKTRAQQIWMRVVRDNAQVVSPDVTTDLENLQRLVTYLLDGLDLPEQVNPAIVADENTFRPSKPCDRTLVEQFIGRTLESIRWAQARDAGQNLPTIEVTRLPTDTAPRADRYRTGRRDKRRS